MPVEAETAAVCARTKQALGGFANPSELDGEQIFGPLTVADLRHLLRCGEAWEFVRENLHQAYSYQGEQGVRFAFEFGASTHQYDAPTPLAAVLSALDATSTETDR